jgi:hypothetical protein
MFFALFWCCCPFLCHHLPYIPTHHCRTCSTLLFSNFVEEKRKKSTVLFVWDTGSYKGSFLVIVPCIYVLLHQLVHLLYAFSFYLSLFLMVVSDGLRFLYSFLYRECNNHIHFLSFPHSS